MRYNMPIEIFYTVIPLILVLGFFSFTARDQAAIETHWDDPDVSIAAIGKQWAWDFQYNGDDEDGADAVWTMGVQAQTDADGNIISELPTLVLPVDQKVTIQLQSRDVIHSFWIPAFYFKLDVIPGHPNSFDVTPDKIGTYSGKCAELCGTYHAAMLFTVHVVSEEEYVVYLNGLKSDPARVGEIKAPEYPNTVPSVPAAEEEHK